VWLLLVSFPLLCGMVGCGEKAEPIVTKSEPATKKFEVAKWQLPPGAPRPAIAPFDADQAKRHQESWAEYLGVPVEITNGIGMKLALIPAGEFMMGTSKEEVDRLAKLCPWIKRELHKRECPPHRVRITKPFYLGVYEVAQAEYERVMGKNPSYFSATGDGKDEVSGMDASRFPVERVSWDDAVEFCRKLSELPEEKTAGHVYRLPTEAEWEYACRAGTTTLFHFGSKLNGEEANCDGSLPLGTTIKGPALDRPTTVGSYQPNAFGLYDMHGNVWEWCQDWYDEEYYKESPPNDPQGPTTGSIRVGRGGSWNFTTWHCRSALRGNYSPEDRYISLGFRVAADPPSKSSQKPANKQAEP